MFEWREQKTHSTTAEGAFVLPCGEIQCVEVVFEDELAGFDVALVDGRHRQAIIHSPGLACVFVSSKNKSYISKSLLSLLGFESKWSGQKITFWHDSSSLVGSENQTLCTLWEKKLPKAQLTRPSNNTSGFIFWQLLSTCLTVTFIVSIYTLDISNLSLIEYEIASR